MTFDKTYYFLLTMFIDMFIGEGGPAGRGEVGVWWGMRGSELDDDFPWLTFRKVCCLQPHWGQCRK